MKPGPILLDSSSRSWLSKMRFPIALVQTFVPDLSHDFDSIIGEDDYFRHGLFKDRSSWLSKRDIIHDIRYDTIQNEVDGFESRVYRLFTLFASTSDSITYRLRWE
jgi:hypothetical protein